MPQKLEELTINEVSLVDAPACSETVNGKRVARARVALFKRDADAEVVAKGKVEDGVEFPRGDYAYAPDDVPSHWKLRLTSRPGGAPDARIVGAAVAALGEGFRGNKVEIPADALKGVRARVRAAWRAANPERGGDELPAVLKVNNSSTEGDTAMTVEQIEKKMTEQDGLIAALKAEGSVLKAENALVMKMSKKERKAYASMSDDERKAYMAETDEAKKKACMDKAMAKVKEKALTDGMDEATKANFEKAGPHARAAMLEEAEKKAKAKKAKPGDTEDEPDGDEFNVDDEEDYGKARKALIAKLDAHEELAGRVAKAEETIAKAERQARVLKFAKRAEEELSHTPGTPEEKGEMLMKLADALGDGSDSFEKMLGQLKEADKALSMHFHEVGKSGGSVPAEKVLLAKVEEISKRDGIDQSHAMRKAMEEAPELYLEYEAQNRRMVAAR